jgi:hypothetical protein
MPIEWPDKDPPLFSTQFRLETLSISQFFKQFIGPAATAFKVTDLTDVNFKTSFWPNGHLLTLAGRHALLPKCQLVVNFAMIEQDPSFKLAFGAPGKWLLSDYLPGKGLKSICKKLSIYILDPRILLNTENYPMVSELDYAPVPMLVGSIGFKLCGIEVESTIRQLLAPPLTTRITLRLVEAAHTISFPKVNPVVQFERLGAQLEFVWSVDAIVPILVLSLFGNVKIDAGPFSLPWLKLTTSVEFSLNMRLIFELELLEASWDPFEKMTFLGPLKPRLLFNYIYVKFGFPPLGIMPNPFALSIKST